MVVGGLGCAFKVIMKVRVTCLSKAEQRELIKPSSLCTGGEIMFHPSRVPAAFQY